MDASTKSSPHLEFLREYPKTGPHTPAGNMLRRYWHPVCLSGDLKDLPYAVRMLGEDLVAFRTAEGGPALVGKTCPHRCASLEYAQVRQAGLQCSYHGWTFDKRGRCVDMPLEPVDSPMKKEVRHIWYPVEEWSGVIWAYMGPDKENPPPLPKIDVLARTDGEVSVSRGDVREYNYLNFLENFTDLGHAYVLHLLVPKDAPEDLKPYCDQSVDTDWRNSVYRVFETDFGVKLVLVQNSDNPDLKYVNTWSLALPTHFRFAGTGGAGLPPDFTNDRRESGGMLRIIDDTHFEIFRYSLMRPGNYRGVVRERTDGSTRGLSENRQGTGQKKDYDRRKYPAWEGTSATMEDLVIQEGQGPIVPREKEYLGTSDIGVVLLRRIWRSCIENVAMGKPPKAVITDNEGVVEVDTYKGMTKAADIVLSPRNMPSSKDGRGLIRDQQGNLVFA
jgi:nitrite reductase/ring-hydroxylating ferredoxin subunit